MSRTPPPSEIDRVARGAIRMFLATYGRHQGRTV
ncbi:TetR/AcrR family transcriptional regulator C-terminal domain-containing protein [Rhizobium sp. RAF56]